VEAAHRLNEKEFFDLEGFAGLEDFLKKTTVYQNFFNFARPNSCKGERMGDRSRRPPLHRIGVLALPPFSSRPSSRDRRAAAARRCPP
jgi:hypothetical protein